MSVSWYDETSPRLRVTTGKIILQAAHHARSKGDYGNDTRGCKHLYDRALDPQPR